MTAGTDSINRHSTWVKLVSISLIEEWLLIKEHTCPHTSSFKTWMYLKNGKQSAIEG